MYQEELLDRVARVVKAAEACYLAGIVSATVEAPREVCDHLVEISEQPLSVQPAQCEDRQWYQGAGLLCGVRMIYVVTEVFE